MEKITHEDVFNYFWEIQQPNDTTAYIKYFGYTQETKRYYMSTGGDDEINGVTLDFFQDRPYRSYPPE